MISRRSVALWLCFAAAGCTTTPASEPPFLGRWRDELGNDYVFHSDGRIDFRSAPTRDPAFESIMALSRGWRMTGGGRYEVVERQLVLDAESPIMGVGQISFDGSRMLLRFRSRRTYVLERVP